MMRRLNDVTYDVSSGEQIKIEVTPTNFSGSGSKIKATRDDNDLPPPFSFTADAPVGKSNHVMMEFSFFDDNPGNAVYVVVISGQNDVGCPCGFKIAKTDNVHAAGIRFRVRAQA
jgi:outer membrane protein assembly factor BamA